MNRRPTWTLAIWHAFDTAIIPTRPTVLAYPGSEGKGGTLWETSPMRGALVRFPERTTDWRSPWNR